MLSQSTILRYFDALQTHDGKLAASLFTVDGVIDDFRGRHHAGRETIEKFISQVPELQVEILSRFIEEAQRVTVYGQLTYSGGQIILVRWVFSGADQIEHLCNSNIEHVPAEWSCRIVDSD